MRNLAVLTLLILMVLAVSVVAAPVEPDDSGGDPILIALSACEFPADATVVDRIAQATITEPEQLLVADAIRNEASDANVTARYDERKTVIRHDDRARCRDVGRATT